MKNIINGTEYIKGTAVMAWLAEAREIINSIPRIGEETIRIEHSFTRTGYKVSYIPINKLLDERIANYPHTSFAKRPEVIELLHTIAKAIDRAVEYEASKTVKVIRLSDGKELMETPDVAKMVVDGGLAKYA